jgi:hypothetical protein
MSEYKPDLELRRRVAEAAGWTDIRTDDYGLLCGENNPKGGASKCVPFYEKSFDAILPLVRELPDKDRLKVLNCLDNNNGMMEFELVYNVTPADYCRAYLAAKGEKV